jgi:diguanylate cyclase (GGDEF)-like protein
VQKLSIKVRLIIALSMILLTAFVVLSVLNYQTSRKSMREEIMTSSLPLIRENIYSEIHSSLIEPILVSTTMANDAFLRAWAMRGEMDVDEVTRYLRDIRTRYGFFSVFFVSAQTHRYYHYQGIHKIVSPNNAHDVWYYDFLKSGSDYQLDVDTDEVTGGILTIFINHRIEDYEGNLLGVTGVGVKMDSVARLLSDTQKKYQRRVYMVNPEGLVQAHSDISLVNVFNIREAQGIRDIADQILGLRDNARNFEYKGPNGIVLLSASYVPELDWFVIVEQDEKTLLEATEGNLTRTLVGGFAATLMVILVSMLAVNHFQSRLERMTVTDELTGVANRRRFDEQFEMAKSRHQRGDNRFSLILIDLDGFKKINDKAGHLEGDRVLVDVAGLIREQIRPADLVARWGGDEFIVLAESGLKGAEEVAERIRAAVEHSQIVCPTVCHLTTSMGVAEYLEGESLDNLTSRADEALYQAKQKGRNLVVVNHA